MTGPTEVFEDLRGLLFSIAYRMLASVADAEDVVQEAFLRYHRAVADGVVVESPKAYLSAISTRLSIDQLRSARVRRETYIGEWLPEPLLTDLAGPGRIGADPAEQAQQADSLSMAFLLVLERLNPVERAVFLLHDVFTFEFAEIAEIVGKSADNCRQLAVRARRHVAEHRPRFDTSARQRAELADRFLAALADGDLPALVTLLAADVVVYGDSGGVRPNWPRPIVGAAKVLRLLVGLSEQIRALGVTLLAAELNGQPGALVHDADGRLINVFSFDIADGLVQTVRSVINPAKLAHLGVLADLPELLRRRRASS